LLAKPCGTASNAVAGVVVAYYGEFLDARLRAESRRTTADRLLEFCLSEGLDRAADLDGSFCYLALDALARQFVISTDYLGSRPVFYALCGTCLVFAPEPSVAAYLAGLEEQFDSASLGRYLASGYLARDGSFFRGVRCLRPGHMLTVENGE